MIFIDWKNTKNRSEERITSNLLSYLSSRWYSTKVIGTNIYNIFKMYGRQLSSASIESLQVYKDLFIEDVRTTTLEGRKDSKIFENFGILFNVSRLFAQDYETHNFFLQGYRQQLRFLADAYFNSTTLKSVYQIGQSFNGVSPILKESTRDVLGWKLQTVTGSVMATGDNLIILDKSLSRNGNIVYSSFQTQPGNAFVYTYSKLGINTKLQSNKKYHSGIEHTYFLDSSLITGSVISVVENTTRNVLKADILPSFNYSSYFTFQKPNPYTIYDDSLYTLASGGFLINKTPLYISNEPILINNTPSTPGAITSTPLIIPELNSNIFWYYDWSILTRNDASYKVYIRSYPQLPIPSTVYFKEYTSYYTTTPIMSQLHNSGSLVPINHLTFRKLNTVEDITPRSSGSIVNYQVYTSGSLSTTYIRGRESLKLGWRIASGSMDIRSNNINLNLYNTNFLWEAWIYGIDNINMPGFLSNNVIIYKFQQTPSGSVFQPAPESDGYSITIEAIDGSFNFYVNNTGSVEKVTANIGNYLAELPYRPHYFACLHDNNVIYLQVDDKIVGQGTISNIPNIPSGSLQFQSNAVGVGFDEILLSSGSIGVGFLRSRFRESAPKVVSRKIPQDNTDLYHQLQFRPEANIGEFELHQWSLRGLTTGSIPLPYFYIEGIIGYGDLYAETYGIYL